MTSPSDPLVVREMIAADLSAVLALTRMVPEAPWWSEAHVAQIVASDHRPGSQPEVQSGQVRRGWVCTAAGTPIGFVVLQGVRIPVAGRESEAEIDAEIEAEIESIVVHPEFRCRGIGQSLLRTAMDWCRQNGAPLLRLEVRSRNAPAIRRYVAAGFVVTGRRPGYYQSPADDAVLMALTFI